MVARLQEMQTARDLPAGTVTFLFTDIEGSTQLLHQLKERYVELLEEHHRLLREVFTQNNGHEVDTQGDAFFVAFSRATDAVSAAIAAQQALAQQSWPGDVVVRVRMGLHSGEPGQAMEGYVGTDVHRAARIAHIGHGGQVLLSETTTSLVRDDLPKGVRIRNLGSYTLKDIKQPEAIGQLLIEDLQCDFRPLKANMVEAARMHESSLKTPVFLSQQRSKSDRPLFVARESELEWLKERLEEVCAGVGQVVFVTGEAGAGKTTLINEFVRRTQEMHPDSIVLNGQCNAYAGMGDPYLPFRQVMDMLSGDVEGRYLAGRITRDHAESLWQNIPNTAAALSEFGPSLLNVLVDGYKLVERLIAGGNAKQANEMNDQIVRQQGQLQQHQIFEQFTLVLQALAQQRPLLLFLDDLQWADTGSANMLFHLGRSLSGHPILILGSYRPEEIVGEGSKLGGGYHHHPLDKPLAEFRRTYGDVWLELNLIDESARRSFVNAVIDSENNQLSNTFRSALYRHTEGHALFTVELMRSLKSQGHLIYTDKKGWVEGRRLNWKQIPARIEGIIRARVGSIDQELRELLSVAAVEGDSFTAETLAHVLDLDKRKVVKQLAQELGKRHNIVVDNGPTIFNDSIFLQYRFCHTLFHQYVYQQLTKSEKILLHLEVGKALESIYQGYTEQYAVQLYQHFNKAGDDAKTLSYAFLAGTRARRLGSSRDALRLYQVALTKTDGEFTPAPNIPVHHIHERLGDVYFENLSRHEEAKTHYTMFFKLAIDDRDRARAERKLAGIDMLQGNLERAQQRCESALKRLDKLVDKMEVCRIHCALAYLLLSRDQSVMAEEHALIAMRLAEQTEDARALGDAYRISGILANLGDQLDLAYRCSLASLQHYSWLGDIPQVTHAYNNLGDNCRLLGRMQEAIHYLEKGIRLACRMGDTRDEALLLVTLAEVYMDQSQWAQAIELLTQRALPLAEQSGAAVRMIMVHRLLGVAYEQEGTLELSKNFLLEAERLMRDTKYHRFAAGIYLELAHLHATQCAFESAEAYLKQAQSFARATPSARLTRKTQLCMGYVFARRGKWSEAVQAFKNSVETHAEIGLLAEEAKVRLHLAQAYLHRMYEDDYRLACDQLRDAYRAFKRIEAPGYMAETRQILLQLQCPDG